MRQLAAVLLFISIVLILGHFHSLHCKTAEIQENLNSVNSRINSDLASCRVLKEELIRLKKEEAKVIHEHSSSLKSRQNKPSEALHKLVLYTSVQIESKDSIGGGTIVNVERNSGKFTGYVITAHHVIRKSIEGKETPIKVKLYGVNGFCETCEAELLCFEKNKDLALIKISTEHEINRARMSAKESVESIKVFSKIYTLGCPLGHDPLPTPGHVSSINKKISNQVYWMMSAPTVFGNSGGGVFLEESCELIGVTNMVCTFDNIISTPVYHMSIFLPIKDVYEWLDSINMSHVYKQSGSGDFKEISHSTD